MATLEEMDKGYVSAEDEDFVPDAKLLKEDDAVAQHAAMKAAKKASKRRNKRKRAANTAHDVWAAMKAAEAGDSEAPAPAPAAAKGGAGSGAGAGAGAQSATGSAAGTSGADKAASGSGGGKDPAKPPKKKKRRRSGAAILRALNRPSKTQGDAAKQVLKNILGSVTKRKKKKRTSRVSMASAAARAGSAGERVLVTEIVKFAGKAMKVTKAMIAAEAGDSRLYNAQEAKGGMYVPPPSKGSLDDVMADLTGAKKINTVQKSSMDWETYKAEHGIADEVEHAAKDGYVTKQEFLQRVDYRQFELERDERARQRAKQQAAPGKK